MNCAIKIALECLDDDPEQNISVEYSSNTFESSILWTLQAIACHHPGCQMGLLRAILELGQNDWMFNDKKYDDLLKEISKLTNPFDNRA